MAAYDIDEGAEAKTAPIGFTKKRKFLFWTVRSKPIYAQKQAAGGGNAGPSLNPRRLTVQMQAVEPAPGGESQMQHQRLTRMQIYFAAMAAKHKGLEEALRAVNIKSTPYDFVRRMFMYSAACAVAVGAAFAILLFQFGMGLLGIVLAATLGVAAYIALFQRFTNYPLDAKKALGKKVEKDILFAVRDLVISLRSGMPLFNALTAVSTGYGESSKEFARIVELVQLGMPIEQAIDQVTGESDSKTFKLVMLQASGSIKAGADVVGALQGAVEDATQERVIELRRYGQRLNALAMFYMLFGIIFPSMGIAVGVILTTFVSIITINTSTLIFVLVFIFFIQIVFLNIMRGSRPIFAM